MKQFYTGMRLFLALGVVVALAGMALGADALSPEQFAPVSGDRDAYTPAASFGSDDFLVVWRSGNLAAGDLREGLKFDAQIVGCRIDRTGKLLDPQSIVIGVAPDLRDQPRVAFGPSAGSAGSPQAGVYLVVWQDLRNGKDWDVYAARVTADGKVLDPKGMLVAGGAHNQALPGVAWDGKTFVVVWQDFRSGQYEIYGGRVSKDGVVMDPQGNVLASPWKNNAETHFFGPSVASSGDGSSLVFWMGSLVNGPFPLALCQLMADGKVVGKPTFEEKSPYEPPGGQHATFPAFLAAGKKSYLLTWTTNARMGRGNIPNSSNAAVFDAEGKLVKKLNMAGMNEVWKQANRIRNARAAWDGQSYVAAWDEWAIAKGTTQPVETIYYTRVTVEGESGAKARVSGDLSSPEIKPTVATDGAGTTLIAYEKHPDKSEVPIKIGYMMLSRSK